MILLDGKKVRDERATELRERIQACSSVPTLVILQVGDVPESTLYIEQKVRFGQTVGVGVQHVHVPADITESALQENIRTHNERADVHGIIVQLPLPAHISVETIMNTIAPEKDVDGLSEKNSTRLEHGEGFVPATARGVMSLLAYYNIQTAHKRATVIGRSHLVGMPIAQALQRSGATVTICHKETEDIPAKARQADILVVATGVSGLVTKEYVAEGQVIIDVGITVQQTEGKRSYSGDVDFDAVAPVVHAITPVPGGVGPMTVVSLFENVLDAYEAQGV